MATSDASGRRPIHLPPGGVTNDFENRSASRAGVLNLSIPGEFERAMPEIARWFAENPPGDARW